MLPFLLFSLASFAVMGGLMIYILFRSYVTAEPTVSVLLTAGSAIVAGKSVPLYRDTALLIHHCLPSPFLTLYLCLCL
jgi:hypothetical protein